MSSLSAEVTRALAMRKQSAFFTLRVSVTNDPDSEVHGTPGSRLFVEVLGKSDFGGIQERLWYGSCSRADAIRDLPDLLSGLAHVTRAGATGRKTYTQVALPGLEAPE
jgi:hypothetical protein